MTDSFAYGTRIPQTPTAAHTHLKPLDFDEWTTTELQALNAHFIVQYAMRTLKDKEVLTWKKARAALLERQSC